MLLNSSSLLLLSQSTFFLPDCMEVERHPCKELPEYISVVEGQSFLSAFTKETMEMFADVPLKYRYALKKNQPNPKQTNQPNDSKACASLLKRCLSLCFQWRETDLAFLPSQIHKLIVSKLKMDWTIQKKI